MTAGWYIALAVLTWPISGFVGWLSVVLTTRAVGVKWEQEDFDVCWLSLLLGPAALYLVITRFWFGVGDRKINRRKVDK